MMAALLNKGMQCVCSGRAREISKVLAKRREVESNRSERIGGDSLIMRSTLVSISLSSNSPTYYKSDASRKTYVTEWTK